MDSNFPLNYVSTQIAQLMVKNTNYFYSKTKHLLIQLCSECKMNLLGILCYWGSR